MSQKELIQWTSQLSEEVLAEAEKADLDAENNFVEAIARVRVVRRLAEAYDEAPPDERPDNANSQAQQSLQRATAMVKSIQDLRFGAPNYHQERTQITNELDGICRTWRQDIRPHIRESSDLVERAVEADRIAARAKETLAEIEHAQGEVRALERQATELTEKIKVLSGEVGAGQLASYYDAQAQTHGNAANKFILGSIGSAVALVGIGWALFGAVPKGAGSSWNQLLPELTIRIFTLGVLGYAVSFCAKSYRANKHLQYSNEHRRNALKTYILFRESTSSEDVQNIITTELVRAVFSAEETGFLDKSGDKTIIEEQASLLALLGATRKP